MASGWRANDAVLVNPVVGVQTPANRFGRPNVEREIHAKLAEIPQQSQVFDDVEEFEEDSESSEEDMTPAQQQQPPEAAGVWNGMQEDAPAAAVDDSDTESSSSSTAASATGVPQFARYRMNLTALSQHYNLYFVAHRDKIHVHVPQNAPQIIRDGPLLALRPRPSEVASLCPGHIDHGLGHQVTNMIVGELGDLEVVVAAFDNGDVVGYYTHAIAAALEHAAKRSRGWMSTPRPPREFFHAAVGRSAWGLAIHKKSRLIAVSCNLHEVTVFAFALRAPGDPAEPAPVVRWEDESPFLSSSGLRATALEKHLRSRTRDWRIILPMSIQFAANIPAISFLDDEKGNADKVLAVDVLGNCWMLDIWKLGMGMSRVPLCRDDRNAGWGVMVLPDSFFKQVGTAEEFLGTTGSDVDSCLGIGHRVVLDISRSANVVPENPTSGSHVGVFTTLVRHELQTAPPAPVTVVDIFERDKETDGDWIRESRAEPDEAQKRWAVLMKAQADAHRPRTANAALGLEKGANRNLALTIVPNIGFIFKHDGMGPAKFLHEVLLNPFRKRHPQYDRSQLEYRTLSTLPRHLSRIFSILRTCESGIELFSLDTNKASVICRRLLRRHNPDDVKEPWDMSASERLCMIHCIPELSLVVVGSACGRVALLRLVRAPPGLKRVRHGFRVEWVLPRRAEEERKLRPHVWMVGMAVSPVPQPGARGVNLFPPGPRERRRHNQPLIRESIARWRLLLYYMDHTVLAYTIEAADAREPSTVTLTD